MNLETATWKRRQYRPDLTPDQAKDKRHGNYFEQLRLAEEVSVAQCWSAEMVMDTYERYCHAMGLRNPRSASDYSGPSGYDGSDPFESERAERDERAVADWKAVRRAILESGPFGMMAVEAILFENKPMQKFVGDLRLALNEVARLKKRRKAA
ncbi:hypothetical protein [Pseudohoeflea coraliihabitans]|uniref:Uncharacterized protein n=1 Tax=Pseudohoeflea coraliihabitans TaxID=2860393 RepID=A0ABS6WKI8_9HYPH|nr:hypothetical protein [Pseudohoeflea sp. DP4N28-3]MBW3095655.1 hypothetical protein [Pseudohoeflea sp. DP4N28-3]